MYFKVVNGAIEINAKRILEEINLEIKDKDHVAIIGRNGAGKSTLLKSFVDTSLLEEGIGEDKFSITILDHPIIGFLKQNEGYHGDLTLLQYILQVYEPLILLEKKMEKLEKKMEAGIISALEFDQYVELQEAYKNQGGYLYKKEYLTALAKNGFQDSDLNKKLSSFSGGELTKISFLRLLLSKPDLLLLDEPTNHLDILAIEWLEDYLKRYPKAFVVVSHDRMFLNRIVNKIYEIEYGQTTLYHGNYDYYIEEKEKILACSTVEGEFYGTPKIDLNNPKYTDKCIIIDIGAKGIEELKQIYKNIIPIYVMPPTQERIKQNRNQNRLQRSLKYRKDAGKTEEK